MKTAPHFLLAVVLFTAVAFTFSCSSDDDGDSGSGGGISDLPKQLYLNDCDMMEIFSGGECNEYEYKGSGDITISLDGDWGAGYFGKDREFPAGKIQNGQVILDLPENIDGYHKIDFEGCDRDEPPLPLDGDGTTQSSCETNISYPKDLALSGQVNVHATISGKNCDLSLCEEGEYQCIFLSSVGPLYSSKSGKVVGTSKYTSSYGDTSEATYDLNLSKGWNVVWTDYYQGNYSTNPQAIKKLRWVGRCN
jgi:hypothetical protein